MDSKIQTFLTLCKRMNYRVTAEELHMTQPAVTRQIQALEQYYDTKLFRYEGHRLYQTESCRLLESYCRSLQYNYEEMKRAMQHTEERELRIGATKTIGDSVLAMQIRNYLQMKEHKLSLQVDNTENLLQLLDHGELDFAVVEGSFQKQSYAHRLLRNEPFVGICPSNHPFAGKTILLEALFSECLILREPGSGTRNILERELKEAGYDWKAFSQTVTIGSFAMIRELVRTGTGISFVYEAAAAPDIGTFQVEGFRTEHAFQIVYLKDTKAEQYVDAFFPEMQV